MSAVAPYLLDTTVLIDVARRREPTTAWLNDRLRSPDRLGISAVSVAEFFAGLSPKERTDWRQFLNGLIHWNVTKDIAVRAGILRYDLSRQGRTLLIPDALIAATALEVGATLVTANVRHFSILQIRIVELI
jgi:predicted nucleic acid-binding protein